MMCRANDLTTPRDWQPGSPHAIRTGRRRVEANVAPHCSIIKIRPACNNLFSRGPTLFPQRKVTCSLAGPTDPGLLSRRDSEILWASRLPKADE